MGTPGGQRGSHSSQAGDAVFYRTHDRGVIERILRADAFDAPIPYFSKSLLRSAVDDLLASSPDVYFLVAEVRGEYAGFVLTHLLGPTLWRKFARDQFAKHPFGIVWVTVRLKVVRPLLWKIKRWVAGTRTQTRQGRRFLNAEKSCTKQAKPFHPRRQP